MQALTFDALYGFSGGVSVELAAAVGVVVGLAVLVGLPVLGPILTPLIVKLGAAIGGLYGLSGAAAANFGLALLGGGAISGGGLGVAGGTALLAAALTTGGELLVDRSLSEVMAQYDRAAFEKASLNMMTLPVPINLSGAKSAALDEANGLLNVRWWETLNEPSELTRVLRAIEALERSQLERPQKFTQKERTVLSLLYFIAKEYEKSHKVMQSERLLSAQDGGAAPTQFMLAISELHRDQPDIDFSVLNFERAIATEPNAVIVNVLFASYFDRLFFWAYEGRVTTSQLHRLEEVAMKLPSGEKKLLVVHQLASFYLMRAEAEQLRVLALRNTRNPTLQASQAEFGERLKRSRQEIMFMASRMRPLIHEAYAIHDDLRKVTLIQRIQRDLPVGNMAKRRSESHQDLVSMLQRYEASAIKYETWLKAELQN